MYICMYNIYIYYYYYYIYMCIYIYVYVCVYTYYLYIYIYAYIYIYIIHIVGMNIVDLRSLSKGDPQYIGSIKGLFATIVRAY